MANAELLITENLDLWSSAVKAKSSAGRGTSKKLELYGISKLRELILDLAVRGMLIPQETADERSSILLQQASAERTRLERDRTIKAVRIKPIEADEEPYKIPGSWCWARFPQLCHYSPGKTPSTKNPSFWASEEDALAIPWVSISDMQHSGSISTTNKKVSTLAKEEIFKREEAKAGSILMSFKLTVGKISRISVDAYHNEAIISVTPFTGILDEYIFKFLPSRALAGNTKSAIMGNTLNASSLAQLLIPVPPLAEQHRIVAKVDELMALCDQLEEEQENNLETLETLVSTLLDALTSAAADASQFAVAWKRIQDNFDILFTTESSVDQLKQTILQLAVMGKLVEQDPGDEPVKILLERIAIKKEKMIREKRIPKQKPIPEISEAQKYIPLPQGWHYTKIDTLCGWITSGSTPQKSEFTEEQKIPYLKVYNIREQIIDFAYKPQFITESCHKSLLKRSILRPGDVVMNIVGPPLGKTAIIPNDFPEWNCNQAIAFFRLIEPALNSYIHLFLKSGTFLSNIELVGTAGQDNISVTKSRNIVIPLPPLAEQHRIIATVDEMIKLCDQLKAKLSQAKETQLTLADSLVEQAIHSPT